MKENKILSVEEIKNVGDGTVEQQPNKLEQNQSRTNLRQHLQECLDLRKGGIERIELLEARNLLGNYNAQREALDDERLEGITIAIVPDDLWVKGSQPSESHAREQLILIKQSYYETQENPDEIAWTLHELAHCQKFLDYENSED